MAEKMSTALCNALLGTASGFQNAFPGHIQLRLYFGTVPATADAAPPQAATVIIDRAGSGLHFAASATGGVLSMTSTETASWTGTSNNGSTQTLTFYRLTSSTNEAETSDVGTNTQPRVQGTIGVGGSDMNVGSASIASGATFTVNTFTQAIVPS